ncbi:hypothetical protein CDO26_27880 (plasmid) [Sinorhizobium meliloti]|uniref:hypothetical protein n=1 Tax=Rhizobium meliloti TaxID=382 RepID=UPI000B49FA46|nr:hypothetical protein [Sinorhizobium meliloti]ASP88171.1 hypothetical protein CDO26_27880 [Sinorhizobium meliloti]MQW30010.1 hypothetical protein [Sinorhizobium meliloti]
MEEEAIIPETGTADLSINDAVDMLNRMDDMSEDSSVEHTDDNVESEPASEETDVETPDNEAEQFFEIDGNQVPLSEIRASYLRQADYTRKTQELAEQRKAYQLQQVDINEAKLAALQGIEQAKVELRAMFAQNPEPNWEELLREDPHSFMLAQYEWQKREAAVKALYEQEMSLRQQTEAYEKEQHQLTLQESQKQFLQKYPEMRDRAKSAEVLGEITGLLIDNGFSKEEIQGVSDWRIVGLLYELNKAIKSQKAVSEIVPQLEKTKPPISVKQPSSKGNGQANSAKTQFNKTRSVNDAVAYLNSL